MQRIFLVAVADLNLNLHFQFESAVSEFFGSGAHVKLVARDAEGALKAFAKAKIASEHTCLVVDANLPSGAKATPHQNGVPALELLEKLRRQGKNTSTIVITPRAMGIPEIDVYCSPDNQAIALPQDLLDNPAAVGAFVKMLGKAPEATWNGIEIEIEPSSARCFLRLIDGDKIEWRSGPSNVDVLRLMAKQYKTNRFDTGWAQQLHTIGSTLFVTLVSQLFGSGFFAHLERAVGGLSGLAFRFHVSEPNLFGTPFEAMVRLSGVGGDGPLDEFRQNPFMLLYAPITRRICVNPISPAPIKKKGKRTLPRVLFIRAQPGEHPASPGQDLLAMKKLGGEIQVLEFKKLDNIDREREMLCSHHGKHVDLEELNLTATRGKKSAAESIAEKLSKERFDIVHFAGHSITTSDGLTYLILPGMQPGEAEQLVAESFAKLASKGGTRLVYLSSCQGSSANSVATLAQRDVPCVLGFRWDVEDAEAADFATTFYEGLFEKGLSICKAFRDACFGGYKPADIETSHIWVSPILASQSENWIEQRVL
jgi:CHAT domain